MVLTIFGQALSTIYSPCTLARQIYKIFIDQNSKFNPSVLDDIPLLVCIAGYHRFDSKFTYTTPNGVKHVGPFGISSSLAPNSDILEDHLSLFVKNVLYIGAERNSAARNFYESLCHVPILAKEIKCHLDDYVFGNYAVIVPKYTGYLYNYYQQPNSYFVPVQRTPKKSLPQYFERVTNYTIQVLTPVSPLKNNNYS